MATPSRQRIGYTWLGFGLIVGIGLGGYLVNEHLYSPFGIEPTAVPASPLVSKVTPEELPPPGGVDVSSVHVGQTYHFRGLQPGVVTTWRIQEITHDAIRYEEGELKDGRYEPRGSFLFPRVTPAAQSSLTRIGQERVEVSGTRFDCDVFEAAGIKSWSSPHFPGTLRTTAGARVVRVLVKIEARG